jgi:hypothetical protein
MIYFQKIILIKIREWNYIYKMIKINIINFKKWDKKSNSIKINKMKNLIVLSKLIIKMSFNKLVLMKETMIKYSIQL